MFFPFRNVPEQFRNKLERFGTVLHREEKRRKEKRRFHETDRERIEVAKMETGHAEKVEGTDDESKRARIRRLLLDPLTEDGFRKSGNVTAEKHKTVLARLADDLAYMSDESLDTLRTMLRTKGQGRQRDIWPSSATILGFAELIEARPLKELPGLLRWFGSVEGPRALRAGTLVETWAYFRKHKRPPIHAGLEIERRAADNRRNLELYRERMGRGSATEDEVDWVRRYEERLAYCEGLVTDVEPRAGEQ